MKYITLFSIACILSLLSFAQDKNAMLPEIHVAVTTVEKGGNDTLWLKLNGGSNIGLAKGMDGSAVQVYRNKERDYTILSKAIVTKATEKEAIAFVINKEQKEEYLIIGDQVVFANLPVRTALSNSNLLLFQLAAFNIRFADQSADPFYDQIEILKNNRSIKLDSLLTAFQQDVIETVVFLKEMKEKPRDWTEPLTVSRFKGTNLLDAMEQTSLLDVESFLQFVLEYPGKYIGRKWKFNETYATWLINDMPPPANKSYLVNSVVKTPATQMNKWLQENRFYYDSSKQYIATAIDNYIADKKTDSAEWLITKAVLLSEAAKDAGFLSGIYTSKAQLIQAVGGNDHQATAIGFYKKAIDLDSLNWKPFLYRAHLYGDMEQYDLAIKDAKLLVRRYPDYGSAWGSQGWWYLKQFKIKEAGICCLKAYELDTASSAWAVNLAHYYLLTGQNEKARAFYQKTLDNLKTESDFINGPLTDFAFFEERGVLNHSFEREKVWMLKQYDANYKHHLRADSLFKVAKEKFSNKEWDLASINFNKCRDAERSAENKRFRTIHNITTWIGFMNFKMKEYDRSEAYYTEALAMAKKDFPDQLQNDLELFAELYNKWGKKALADAYAAKASAWKNKETETTAPDLHVVSIGIDEYKDLNYRWAASDARKIADAFTKKGKGFGQVHTHVLTNKQAVGDSVDITMQRIIVNAKEDDTFVFYFTGKAVNNEKESFLIPYGLQNENDSTLRKKAISAQLLRSWSNSIPSKHQFFLLDAAAANFSSAFADNSMSLSKTVLKKDMMMIAAGFPRIEEADKSSGVIAAAFLNLFSDSVFSTEKLITGKKLETFFADEITRNNYYLPLESYSQGRDFALAENNPQQIQAPRVSSANSATINVRGAGVENVSQSTGYTINKRYGLFIATDVYADPKWTRLNNPISDATDLKKALEEEYGFEIEIVPNPTKSEIFKKIDEYSRKKFDKNDQLVILFAGHGYYDSRRNEGYLVPSDASYTNNEFDRYYYPMSNLMRDLKIIPAEHIMVLVDACHGGAICDNALMRSGTEDMYSDLSMDDLLKNHLSFPNRVILTSGRKDQRVPDGIKGRNSPFIAAILNTLRSREAKERGTISYYQLMKNISDVQKTQATSALFSAGDNWDFMFFRGGNKKSPIGDPNGFSKN